MLLLFLASVAGLFPGVALPFAVGWKKIAVFDALFAAILADAWRRRGLRAPDRRLCAAAAAFVLTGVVSLAGAARPEGLRLVASLGYSMVVFLTAAHLRVAPRQSRLLMLGPMALTVAVAWIVFAIENSLGVEISDNESMALPTGVHRLGGLTGGNALILFLAMAIPFAHPSWPSMLALLISSFPTLSRSMMGVGIAVLLGPARLPGDKSRVRAIATVLAATALVAGGFAYLFLPWGAGIGGGAYPGLHRAALRMWAAAPITGLGPARFPENWVEFSTDAERRAIPGNTPDSAVWDPHSAFLGLAAEQGLLGVVALIWLLREVFARVRTAADPHHGAMASAALIGLLVGGALVDWLTLKGLWLWIGLMVAAAREPVENPANPG